MSKFVINGQESHLTPKGIKVGKTFIASAARLAAVLANESKGVRRAVLSRMHRDAKGPLASETSKLLVGGPIPAAA